jgi:TonB family protein
MGYQALLFCPDEKLARVVSQVFSELDFAVEAVSEPFAAVKKLMAQHYDAVAVDCDNEQNSSLLLKSARNSSFNQGSLAIALVEGQAGVARAYRIGANLVLTKPINVEQAKGTLRVARGLLRKNSDATGQITTAAPAVAPSKPATGAPAATARPSQPMSHDVQAIAPTPAQQQAPEVQAPLQAVAAARVEAKPALVPTPAAQSTTLAATPALGGSSRLGSSEQDWFGAARTEAPKPAGAATAANVGEPSAPSALQGAAAAPARAKNVAAPPAHPAHQEQEKIAETQHSAYLTSLSGATSTSPSPSFAELGAENAAESGGNKKILIAIAVLTLAAASYFGWTKFGHTSTNPVPGPAGAPPPRSGSSPDLAPMSAPAPAPSSGPVNRANVTSSPKVFNGQPEPKAAAASSGTSATGNQALGASSQGALASASSAPHMAAITEPDAKKTSAAPLLVKPSMTKVVKAQPEDGTAVAPSPLAVASPSSTDLGNLVSTTSNAPKPALARIRVSQGVSQGLVIKRVQPKYPLNALAAHIQGAVQIEATVDKDGNVVNPKVLSGDQTLAAAAIEAVRQWRYKPYYLDGAPVEIQTQITVNFKAN